MADTSKTLEVLKGARDLISDPKRWFQGDYCNGAGDAFCAYGALNVAAGLEPRAVRWNITGDAERALERTVEAISRQTLNAFNDTHSHAEVLAAFDKAIAALTPEPTEPTPNADGLLDVMDACQTAGDVVARQIVAQCPSMALGDMAALVTQELFGAAQDCVRVAEYAARA